jgi:hypothetical protein
VRGKSLRVADTWDILDALALESVGDADSNGIELSRVLGLIDYVNRTVLNHDETERTLRRLLGSGLVAETRDGFRRTAAGQELHARCPSKFPRDRARWIESRLLQQVPCVAHADWTLPSATFDLALSQYFDEMRRLLGRDD